MRKRDKFMDLHEYEKSLDRWSAALVSRQGHAPRAMLALKLRALNVL